MEKLFVKFGKNMSKIGKKPIKIPENVEVKIEGSRVTVSGPKGELERKVNRGISVEKENGSIVVSSPGKSKRERAMWGLNRALLANMVRGVTEKYRIGLEMRGLGYGASVSGDKLVLKVGYSHPVELDIPEGLEVSVENKTIINIQGVDKQLVGQFAAKIRALRKPEPYQGRGIRYLDEHVRRKAGKAAKVGVGGSL